MINPNTGKYYHELSTQPLIEQLQQLTQLVWDGDLISKSDTRELHKLGYIDRWEGWNLITRKGVERLQSLGYIAP